LNFSAEPPQNALKIALYPGNASPEKVQARYSNGVLEIELERLEADRPKKIQIRAA
jgi:HSP20 family molecular chaperone IbpA